MNSKLTHFKANFKEGFETAILRKNSHLRCRIVQDSGVWTLEKVCKRGLAVSFSTGTRLSRF
jgi:hypothetical protein